MHNLIRHVVASATLTGATLCGAAPLAAQIHEGMRVRIRAPSVLFQRFEGIYLGRKGDTVLVGNEERAPVRIPAAAITEMDVSRGKSRTAGALAGALWGGGIGLVLGGVMVASMQNQPGYGDEPNGVIISQIAVGSAEIGAIIGAIVGKRRWTRAQPEILLRAARVAPRALGVQFAIRYTR